MRRTVYVETTVPNAHVTARTDAGSVFRRQVTGQWWIEQLSRYDALTSDAVLLELMRGEWPGQPQAISLVEDLPRVPIDAEVVAVAERYIAERIVTAALGGDAAHLAAACVHELDFLLTWNIRHLANPDKLSHLTVVNRRLGLPTPQIVTPEVLWEEDS
jgi:hypothetical protein